MRAFIVIVLFCCAAAAPADDDHVTPEFLDQLLAEKRYAEFDKYMNIPFPNLSGPSDKQRSKGDLMFNQGLLEGDMLLAPLQIEEGRQGIRFDKYPGSRWPNSQGQPSNVPYVISNQFSSNERRTIQSAIGLWNSQVRSVQFVNRRSERDFINIFPGNGCWAHLGRTGGRQSISLQRNGCVYTGTILHEMDHAIGVHHEQNRLDRDEYVEVLWENIPDEWKSQYEKTDPEQFGLQAQYDYYSIMHYPMNAPGTGRPAFRIIKSGIDESRIGNGNDFTEEDLKKIEELYG